VMKLHSDHVVVEQIDPFALVPTQYRSDDVMCGYEEGSEVSESLKVGQTVFVKLADEVI
jgi:hypothetical protein